MRSPGEASAQRVRENADRVLVARVVRDALTDVPVAANPIAQAMGMTIERAQHGRVWLRFHIGEQFTQGGGMIQGGIVAAMLDFGMAFAALTTVAQGESVASVSLTVNYLRPTAPGRYRVHAHIEKEGGRMLFARADLAHDDGEAVASASAPITILRPR